MDRNLAYCDASAGCLGIVDSEAHPASSDSAGFEREASDSVCQTTVSQVNRCWGLVKGVLQWLDCVGPWWFQLWWRLSVLLWHPQRHLHRAACCSGIWCDGAGTCWWFCLSLSSGFTWSVQLFLPCLLSYLLVQAQDVELYQSTACVSSLMLEIYR